MTNTRTSFLPKVGGVTIGNNVQLANQYRDRPVQRCAVHQKEAENPAVRHQQTLHDELQLGMPEQVGAVSSTHEQEKRHAADNQHHEVDEERVVAAGDTAQ